MRDVKSIHDAPPERHSSGPCDHEFTHLTPVYPSTETLTICAHNASQARPPAQAFIGYGGVTIREAVRDGADWFVTDFSPLIEVLNNK